MFCQMRWEKLFCDTLNSRIYPSMLESYHQVVEWMNDCFFGVMIGSTSCLVPMRNRRSRRKYGFASII